MSESISSSRVPTGLVVSEQDATTTVLMYTDTNIAPKLRRAARVCLMLSLPAPVLWLVIRGFLPDHVAHFIAAVPWT